MKTKMMLCTLAAVLLFTACGQKAPASSAAPTAEPQVTAAPTEEPTLPEAAKLDEALLADMEAIFEAHPSEADLLNRNALEDGNTGWYLNTTDTADMEAAIVSESEMNMVPFSLVLIRAEAGKVDEVYQRIYDAANPMKWVCLTAEQVYTACWEDGTVALVLSTADMDVSAEDVAAVLKERHGQPKSEELRNGEDESFSPEALGMKGTN